MIKILAKAGRAIAAKIAGYVGREQVVALRDLGQERTVAPHEAGATDDLAIVRHYVPTRTAVVCRTWLGPTHAEVTIMRKRNKRPTFQGRVEAVPGGWRACDPDGATVYEATGPDVSYLDVEAHLLRLRTRRTAHGDYNWPAAMLAMLAPLPKPSCHVCGQELDSAGECRRPDLHWTAESLAAKARERAERRARERLTAQAA